MKKFAITLSLLALGIGGTAPTASAQRHYDERPGINLQVQHRGYPDRGRGGRGGRAARAAALELQHLDRELRRTREDIRMSRRVDRRIRVRYQRVAREAAHLNAGYRRGAYTPREVWSRAQQLRAELREIQRDLRWRGGRRL